MQRAAILVGLMAPLQGAGATARSELQSLPNERLTHLYSILRPVFLKYYPQATSEVVGDRLHFEHDTRIFMIHVPLMTGEWQVRSSLLSRRCQSRIHEGVHGHSGSALEGREVSRRTSGCSQTSADAHDRTPPAADRQR